MLGNYVIIAFRNLSSHRLFSFINVLGLAIGIACVMLITLFVVSESGYDTQWANADRTYRVMRNFNPPNGGTPLYLATNAPPVGPLLQRDYPQFEHVVRVMDNTPVVSLPDSPESYYEPGFYFVDPDIFSVFNVPLLEGDPEALFDGPFQVVVTESFARKYFGTSTALGQTLMLNTQVPVQITGVMEDLPENTHLDAQAFVSMATADVILGDRMQSWGFNNFHTYVVAERGYDMADFEAGTPDFLRRHVSEDAPSYTSFSVMKLSDIHLHSHRDNELEENGSSTTVLTFTAIAIFILLIACFNFMNLSTARSLARAREVGMRKVCGAGRWQIALQFLTESIFITLLAVLLAALFVQLSLPWFNSLLGKELHVPYGESLWLVPALFGSAVLVGMLAGSYPAFYLSSFPCVSILKGKLTKGSGGATMRKILVVVQFAISIGLVVASGIALSQLRYAQTLDLGFNREQVLIYRGSIQEGLGSNYQTMKQELLRHPEIISVTAANLLPGDQNTNSDGIRYEGGSADVTGMGYLNVDYDFFETFDIQIRSGRSFSKDRGTDLFVPPDEANPRTTASYILNELAVQQLGWSLDDAVGKWIESYRSEDLVQVVRGQVIGVADNIHFSSIREAVKPVYYRLMNPDDGPGSFPNLRHMAIRVTGNNLSQTLAFVNETWTRFLPGTPVQQSFLDADFAALYEGERRQGQLFTWFSVMAVFIAVLGLFGLASYLTEQRTREIGIRKVLGSTTSQLVALLTKDFVVLVIIANLLAWPLAWYFMRSWLQNFAYRVTPDPLIFMFAGFMAVAIAAITVGVLVARTANVNPVLSLRHL